MIKNSVVFVIIVLLITTTSFADSKRIINYGECTTPSGDRASCIELEQCTFLYNMLLEPQLLKNEDRVFLAQSQCGANNGKILICCPDGYMSGQQPQLNPRGALPKPGSLPEPGICGSTFSNRIYGGTVTQIDEFPWMALIEYDTIDGSMGHKCGGSLINDRYVLTAAHCIDNIPETWRPVRVRLGEWDTATNNDCAVDTLGNQDCADPHIDVQIENVITHPNYLSTSKNHLHDIALLRLSRSVTYTDFIRPICLPIKDSLKDISFDGVSMDIAGWGQTEYGRTSKKLKAEVPGMPLRNCQRVYARKYINLENSQLCAGGNVGTDSCRGDSGGGLYALDASNRSRVYNYIAGVISFGPTPCGKSGWPGVYTKVSSYIDWIRQNIQP